MLEGLIALNIFLLIRIYLLQRQIAAVAQILAGTQDVQTRGLDVIIEKLDRIQDSLHDRR